jgi:hypothetical protein
MVGTRLLFSQHSPDSRMRDTHLHWYPSCADFSNFIHNIRNILPYFRSRKSWSSPVGNTRCRILLFTKAAMDTCKISSYLDIFTLDTFLGINDESSRHYRPPNRAWNEYQLALGLSTSSQQLAITTQLTHNYCSLYFTYKDLEIFQDFVGLMPWLS